MKVLVLGAGVVGTTAAHYLNRAGHEVTVVDRQPDAGLETSFANGGQIAAAHAEPWAHPGALLQILQWLGREDAPLLFRPRWDPAMIAWALRFLRNCTPGRARRNIERTLRIALYSRTQLKALRAETGLNYDAEARGILHIYRHRRAFDAAARAAAVMAEFGLERQVVSAEDCRTIEPALATSDIPLAGGIFSAEDESGDAHLFTHTLARHAAAAGVEFRFGTTITGLIHDPGRITGVTSTAGTLRADAYLVCLGSYSPLLLRPLGLRLPIYPCKGYSLTLPVGAQNVAPRVSITDDSVKMVYSRLGTRLRAAGTAELDGYSLEMAPQRRDKILREALALFPNAGDPSRAEFWCGLRPVTPDSVPLIGPTPYANLYLNTGHGTLGWTMSCGSGRAIADLISGYRPEISLDGLGLARFGGHNTRPVTTDAA